MIRLLIVDDSALMRRQLSALFTSAGGFEVHQARNGREAVEANRRVQPDVVTLDINMPEMDGITALSLLMAERPVPVVMVSSLTAEGALATFEALNLGAVDYIAKPGGTISLSIEAITRELLAKVKAAARARVGGHGSALGRVSSRLRRDGGRSAARPSTARRNVSSEDGVVVIGVSTGGPRTLEDILPLLEADFPWPILIAQHMPAAFTRPFADRLDQMCQLRVVEVASPMPLQPGTIYVAKGGADMVVGRRGSAIMALARPEQDDFLWHPSAELLARSVLEHFPAEQVVGVMLTGMGHDGADAFTEIRKRGGRTIAESQETAVVFGMPAELIERGGAGLILPCDRIAAQLSLWAGREARQRQAEGGVCR